MPRTLALASVLILAPITAGPLRGPTGAAPRSAGDPALNLNWQSVGPSAIGPGLPGAGKISALAIDPTNPQIIYAGSGVGSGFQGPFGEGGIFATTTGGSSWTRADTGLSDPMVGALWLDPTNPQVVLAGTWTTGIFRSADGGAHWGLAADASQVSSFVAVGASLYAATATGVMVSRDDGATWATAVTTSSAVGAMADGGGVLYLGLDNGSILLMNLATGAITTSYTPTGNAVVWSMAADPTNGAVAYAVEWPQSSTTTLLATTDGGSQWAPLTLGPGCGFRAQAVGTGPGVLAVAGEGGSCITTDGGTTWDPLNGGWDNRIVDVLPGGTTYALGSDQGLYLTHDTGSTWVSLNGGIDDSLTTSVAVSGTTILAAVQDYSYLSSFDGGATWFQPSTGSPGGEDGAVAFNPGNPSLAYACTAGGLAISTDGGHDFSLARGLPPGPCDTAITGASGQLAFDPANPQQLYVGSSNEAAFDKVRETVERVGQRLVTLAALEADEERGSQEIAPTWSRHWTSDSLSSFDKSMATVSG